MWGGGERRDGGGDGGDLGCVHTVYVVFLNSIEIRSMFIFRSLLFSLYLDRTRCTETRFRGEESETE